MKNDDHNLKDCSLRNYVWNKTKHKDIVPCDVCLYYNTMTCPNYIPPKCDKFVDMK